MHIGKSIKQALLDRNMTQAKLAKKLNTSPSSMSQICSRSHCSESLLIELCKAFEMKASEFIALGE